MWPWWSARQPAQAAECAGGSPSAPSQQSVSGGPEESSDSEHEEEEKTSANCNLLMVNACDNKEVLGYRLPHDTTIRMHTFLKPKPGQETEKAK
jgi:hypothetical protein